MKDLVHRAVQDQPEAPGKPCLPYPPAPESLWRIDGGKIVRTPAYSGWLTAARAAIRASAHPVVFGPYHMTIIAYPPNDAGDAHRDIDSLLGPLTAALTQAGLVSEGALAERVVIRWANDACPGGRLEVSACSINGDGA